MTHLLQIALGPVQGFIAASRKTRDLAAGSALLVELAGAAAKALDRHGAAFIFPSDWNEAAANVLLVECDGPAEAAASAKAAALAHLKDHVREAAETAGRLVDPIAFEAGLLDAQAEALLEWYAVWTPRTSDYAADRRRAATLLTMRKAIRGFGPAPSEPRTRQPDGPQGRPKSPLDPGFAGVLRVATGWGVDRGAPGHEDVRVKGREHLDAVGLVKRFGKPAGVERFPSVWTIAIQDCLGRADAEDRAALESLVAEADAAIRGETFDVGDALYGDLEDVPQAFHDRLRRLAAKVRKGPEDDRVPLRSYYAVLHGDGDSMGDLLDRLAQQGPGAHRQFSRRISQFAAGVRARVGAHSGSLVYAGGDDVVALCPMATAVDLAIELRRHFEETVERWARETVALERYPSLTVGVAFVHIQENLQDAVGFAKSLEAMGKREDGKDRLTVGVRPRGGADLAVSMRFRPVAGGSEPETAAWRTTKDELESGRLPRGYPYEIGALARELTGAVAAGVLGEDSAIALANSETARILGRKRDREGEPTRHVPPAFGSLQDLERYAKILLTAHFATRKGEDK